MIPYLNGFEKFFVMKEERRIEYGQNKKI